VIINLIIFGSTKPFFMRPRLTYVLSALLVIGTVLSCKKESHSTTPTPPYPPSQPATVYVLGVQDGSVVYWKNGKVNQVYSQTGINYDFGTSSLAASGSNVYIAGFEPANTSTIIPARWSGRTDRLLH
jgi:hypothetical protein